ncbi:MAG: hypothetical protein QW103_02180 [Candidatus Pacearchaeota archaeon]
MVNVKDTGEKILLLAREERKFFLVKLKNECLLLYRDVINGILLGKRDLRKETLFIASVMALFKSLKNELFSSNFGKTLRLKNENGETFEINEYKYTYLIGSRIEKTFLSRGKEEGSEEQENVESDFKKMENINIYKICELFDFLLKYMKDAKIEE